MRRAHVTHAPAELLEAAASDPDAVLASLQSDRRGLSSVEAADRLVRSGRNTIGGPRRRSPLRLIVVAFANPLVVLLGILAVSSFLSGDPTSGVLMLAMITIGVGLRFVQESRANAAAASLESMIGIHATVNRDGEAREMPMEEVVPGDVVHLAAGDMVPADVRVIACKDLFVSQAGLTGEAFPVEKSAATDPRGRAPLELAGICWMGTSVSSGTAEAVVVATGRRTLIGGMSESLESPAPPTAFDLGLERFTWMMVVIVVVMVPLVFLINGWLKGNWTEAFFFALAVAVGLAPEMLPMIVAVCLSRGAIAMAKRKVIVKQLDSIQNLGAMDVLCTDKTGTLTLDRIILERHCDVMLQEDDGVLAMAWLNSHFQTGLRNLMDRAILDHESIRGPEAAEGFVKVDEIPFDFERRVMSVVLETPTGGRRLVCKGAPAEVYARCGSFELDGTIRPMDHEVPRALSQECDELAAEGFRVLAVAYRDIEPKPAYSRSDERELVLRGYVAFLDPPKDSARAAVAAIEAGGIAVKVLTGDNELVTRKICREVGISVDRILTGGQIESMSDEELSAAASSATLMARLTPTHKERVVAVLKRAGHVVGFLGDGINDALALREADVGISVESAVDVARASADCILLEKDLRVLDDGVREGRKVFVNILKYIRMGASSNFGNMFSVLGASVFLPFVPMAPLQILANNLLYDCSQVPIPADDVDPELIARPRPWSIRQILRFILLVGPCSSIFDFSTFAVMWFFFRCSEPGRESLFHTGWFVESLVTQTLIIHVIRTDRIPFFQSRASLALTATTAGVVLVGIWLTESSLAPAFGFTPLPPAYWPFLLATAAAYATLTFLVKRGLVRSGLLEPFHAEAS